MASFKQVAADHRTSERSHFSFRALCNECLQTIAARRPSHEYQIVQDIPQDIELDSYSGLLGQVLENLIVNAMVHGYDDCGHGTIHIAATCSQAWLKIEVSDQGVGIAVESQGRIFDPFFTSKMGRGSVGLGLHIVHNIVTTVLAGRISVISKVDEGTIFTLDIPCTAPQANARQIEQLFVE